MVRISFDQKPYRKTMMQTWGAKCIASPSMETHAGRDILAKFPDTPGSLGIAISEAIEAAVTDTTGNTRYSLGSVLNHVMLHQTIIGLEAKKQLAKIGEYPDAIIGCAGGGSNFAGLAFPFVPDKINGKKVDINPVEPAACPTLTRGPFAYDHGDTAGYDPAAGHAQPGACLRAAADPRRRPALPRHGPDRQPAGGGRASGSESLRPDGHLRSGPAGRPHRGRHPGARNQPCARLRRGLARQATEEGKAKVILFNWSGHGLIDLGSYEKYLSGQIKDFDFPAQDIEDAKKILAKYPKPQVMKSR